MKITWPELKATLESHTVEVPGGLLAGFLVRCTTSRSILGSVWSAGQSWRWRDAKGEHFGERSSQRAAVQVLRDAFDVSRGSSTPRLPFDLRSTVIEAATTPRATSRTMTRPTPSIVAPAPPVRRIVWNDAAPAFDMTAAVAKEFGKQNKK